MRLPWTYKHAAIHIGDTPNDVIAAEFAGAVALGRAL